MFIIKSDPIPNLADGSDDSDPAQPRGWPAIALEILLNLVWIPVPSFVLLVASLIFAYPAEILGPGNASNWLGFAIGSTVLLAFCLIGSWWLHSTRIPFWNTSKMLSGFILLFPLMLTISLILLFSSDPSFPNGPSSSPARLAALQWACAATAAAPAVMLLQSIVNFLGAEFNWTLRRELTVGLITAVAVLITGAIFLAISLSYAALPQYLR